MILDVEYWLNIVGRTALATPGRLMIVYKVSRTCLLLHKMIPLMVSLWTAGEVLISSVSDNWNKAWTENIICISLEVEDISC